MRARDHQDDRLMSQHPGREKPTPKLVILVSFGTHLGFALREHTLEDQVADGFKHFLFVTLPGEMIQFD